MTSRQYVNHRAKYQLFHLTNCGRYRIRTCSRDGKPRFTWWIVLLPTESNFVYHFGDWELLHVSSPTGWQLFPSVFWDRVPAGRPLATNGFVAGDGFAPPISRL